MNLGELKSKIDDFYDRYGADIDIMIDINFNPNIDDTIYVTRGKISTQNIVDIIETKDETGKINGICISNYKMEV